MRLVVALTMAIAVAGCDSTTGGSGGSTQPPFTGFDQTSLKGHTATATAATLTSSGTLSSQTVTAEFAQDGSAQVTKSDGTKTPVMTYDSTSNVYYDASGSYFLAVVTDVTNPNVAILAFGDYSKDPINFSNWTEQMFVAGNKTSLVSVPTSGSATYSGPLYIDTVNSSTIGTIGLNVNFTAATVAGGLSFVDDVGADESYFVKPAPLVSGGFNTSLTDISAASRGTIEGSFYDPNANELAGTLLLSSDAGNVTGAYIANR